MKKYYQRLCGLVRKAITEYDMIHDGDRVAVGVSGGKDSVLLALALNDLKEYMGIDYSLVAITLDAQFTGSQTDFSPIGDLFREKGIEHIVRITDIGPIIFEERHESNPCSLCRKMRRRWSKISPSRLMSWIPIPSYNTVLPRNPKLRISPIRL